MFRRRPKATQAPDAALSRRAERRTRKGRNAPPPGPSEVPEHQADVADDASGDTSSEPWYRQSGPLFEESFSDGPSGPPPQPPSDGAASAFAPPSPADPAAVAASGSVPMIQRVGQVTDPGPLSDEMLGAFEPAAADDETASGGETANGAHGDGAPSMHNEPTAPEPTDVAEPREDPSPWAATPGSEPGIGFEEAATADDGGYRPDVPDPLIDFDAGDDAADETSEGIEPEIEPEDDAAETPSSEVAQHEPPMVVPVRGYYIARTEDTLRSVAAQFLNAPERWSELRALNAAYPGIADLDPDELVPEGAALALPGDPLPWGRPDPVYLWTLAETFLYAAWGREPSPEEVVPFWRGLTQGALPEGEQSPLGIELPDVAQIAARSADGEGEAPPEADVAPTPPAAFEMPAVAEPAGDLDDVYREIEVAPGVDELTAAEVPADAPGDEYEAELDEEIVDVSLADAEIDVIDDVIDIDVEESPAGEAEQAPPVSGVAFEIEPIEPAPPEEGLEAAAPEAEVADAIDAAAAVDTAELAGLVRAAEEAIEAAESPPDSPPDDDMVDAEILEGIAAEPVEVEPEPYEPEPDIVDSLLVEPPVAEPPPIDTPVAETPLAPPSVAAPPVPEAPVAEPPPLEPPPIFEEWIDEPPAMPPPLDPSAPYAGIPGAGTVEAPPRPPEAEAPRVPHFLPSVTGTAPGGLTTAAQTSPVGRSLAGTAVGDAMLLWQLARRRRQSRRAAGVPDAIEQSLLQSAGSESLELIEAAMRHLYAVTVGQQRPRPNVLAVRSGTYGFEVLLDRPVPTPPGWRSASGGFVLELPQGVTARDLGAIGHGPSLCPALVPVGNTFEGPLLLNIEQLGCLAVSGPSAPAASLLHAIVGTLGSSPMAAHLRITAVSLDSAVGMIGWEDVRFASYDSPELEALFANAYGPGDGMIELLVIGPGNDLLIQRASQIATAPESRLSLVGATSAVSARWPWRIHVDDTGTAVVHPISITMTAARAVPPETIARFGGMQPSGIDPAGLR